VATLERELIRRALEASGGNRAEAARPLGISRRYFIRSWKNIKSNDS